MAQHQFVGCDVARTNLPDALDTRLTMESETVGHQVQLFITNIFLVGNVKGNSNA